MLLKCCTQYVQQSWKIPNFSSGHRTRKGQFSFQYKRRAIPNNIQTLWPTAFISHTSKVMLKILQARLQQCMNRELPDVQAGFREGRGTRDQTANIQWIIEKAREFQRNIYFCFIDYAKPFDCVDHNKLWKILKQMWTPYHFTCLLRNLPAGQEAAFRTWNNMFTCNNRLVPNWEKNTSRLYIVTLLI